MALVGSELQGFHPATKEHYQLLHDKVTLSIYQLTKNVYILYNIEIYSLLFHHIVWL